MHSVCFNLSPASVFCFLSGVYNVSPVFNILFHSNIISKWLSSLSIFFWNFIYQLLLSKHLEKNWITSKFQKSLKSKIISKSPFGFYDIYVFIMKLCAGLAPLNQKIWKTIYVCVNICLNIISDMEMHSCII